MLEVGGIDADARAAVAVGMEHEHQPAAAVPERGGHLALGGRGCGRRHDGDAGADRIAVGRRQRFGVGTRRQARRARDAADAAGAVVPAPGDDRLGRGRVGPVRIGEVRRCRAEQARERHAVVADLPLGLEWIEIRDVRVADRMPPDLVAVGREPSDLARGQAPGLVELAAVDEECGVHPVLAQLRPNAPDGLETVVEGE